MKAVLTEAQWTCDWCRYRELGGADLPAGWGIYTEHDCGLTGYSRDIARDIDLCPKCIAKTKAKTQQEAH